MKIIPLTQGKVAKVSDSDYPLLASFRWCALRHRRKWYARRGLRLGSKVLGIKMHRYIMSAPPGVGIDHRDGDGLNNQRRNLRLCTNAHNNLNKGKQRGNFTSQFKGVSKRGAGRWRATINIGGHRHRLGLFTTEIEAARAYNRAARALHKQFAFLNPV